MKKLVVLFVVSVAVALAVLACTPEEKCLYTGDCSLTISSPLSTPVPVVAPTPVWMDWLKNYR